MNVETINYNYNKNEQRPDENWLLRYKKMQVSNLDNYYAKKSLVTFFLSKHFSCLYYNYYLSIKAVTTILQLEIKIVAFKIETHYKLAFLLKTKYRKEVLCFHNLS